MNSSTQNRSLTTRLRYNWHTIFVHAVLIFLGVVNLYPFFWMLGTSLKAEAEASADRMSPFPAVKYKLAPDFSVDEILPTALLPGGFKDPEAYARDFKKLDHRVELLVRMQAEGAPGAIEDVIRATLRSEGQKLVQAARDQLGLSSMSEQERVAALNDFFSHETVGNVTAATSNLLQADLTAYVLALSADEPGRETNGLSAGETAENTFSQAVDTLVVRIQQSLLANSLLERDDNNRIWLSTNVFNRNYIKELEATQTPELLAFRHHLIDEYTIDAREYSKISQQLSDDALLSLEQLELLNVLEGYPYEDPASGEKVRLFVLQANARGAVKVLEGTDTALLPRQVLTLMRMYHEDQKREESRATYAQDSRTVKEYAEKWGLQNQDDLAAVELEAMQAAGLLAPGTVQLMNYWVVLKGENFLLYFMTSVIITVIVVVFTVLISSMLGYALAKVSFPGKFWVLGIMLLASVLPAEARIIPLFKMLNAVGLLENLWGMTLWMMSFGVGNALLMAGFFLSLPKEVDEAASVDGAGPYRTFFDIALPMARPIVMTVGMFAFLSAWNEFQVPLLCTISRPDSQPLAVAVYSFQAGHAGKWHQINAAASIMIIPVILVFLFVQKHVVNSIAVGAVKG